VVVYCHARHNFLSSYGDLGVPGMQSCLSIAKKFMRPILFCVETGWVSSKPSILSLTKLLTSYSPMPFAGDSTARESHNRVWSGK